MAGMTIEEYMAIPYILSVESFEADNGEWMRRASMPELPGCVVEGISAVEIIEQLEQLRVHIIMQLLEQGRPVPVPRPPLKSAMPALNREQLEFSKWLVDHGKLTDAR